MSGVPSTPRTKTSHVPSTPTTTRVGSSHIIQSSPHYATTRRHSLYGVEDRIIIDPGSRIWKVGFSGEGSPRDVLLASGSSGASSLWNLGRAADLNERAEEERLLEVRLEGCLRRVFHDSLLTDPKARKVILVEHPLLPIYIKDMIARILFDNLQVPSVSFASSHLLSLLAVGRITGLVLDCGHLESVALPIFAARPLYPHLRTTPLAGSRLTSHLRSLLLLFGTYLPPPTSLSAAVNIPAANRSTRVPQEVLTDAVIEEIKTRCCFVGDSLVIPETREATPGGGGGGESEASEMDWLPPSSDVSQSESDFSSHAGFDSNAPSSHRDSSEFSTMSAPRVVSVPGDDRRGGGLQALASLYTRHSTATELRMKVTPPAVQQTGTGQGTLLIPGWIRERCAEVLFEGGDVDENSVAEVILDSLLKVPMDLRKTMSSSILITGGTSMLPGFIPRLHAELLRAISPPPLPPQTSTRRHSSTRPEKPPPPPYDRYASLRPLIPYFAILNNPSPPVPMSDRAKANAGKAPAFSPAIMAWVGGSLAGSLKTGGVEVPREKWDEEDPENILDDAGDNSMDISPSKKNTKMGQTPDRPARNVLPDWTRTPLQPSAPSAGGVMSPAHGISPRAARVGA